MRIPLFLLSSLFLHASASSDGSRIFTKRPLKAGSLSNIYIDYGTQVDTTSVTLNYGFCDDASSTYKIDEFFITKDYQPVKFSWYVPFEIQDGCFFAKDASGNIFASSDPNTIRKRFSKRGHPELADMYFNAIDYYLDKRVTKRSNASSKNKKIGIIGAGIAGLFSGYLLDQAGFHNYEILEANNRLGGRIRTSYFNRTSDAYQDIGPMRYPIEMKYKNQTLPITDHKIVFQLVDELNAINNDTYKIEFIKWYQSRPNNLYYKNGFRLPDGRIPTVGEVQQNPNLVPIEYDTSELSAAVSAASSTFFNDEWYKLMAEDLYAAHKKAMDEGYDDWSEWGYLHNKMGLSLNATDYATGLNAGMIWYDMYMNFIFNTASNWRTIVHGSVRLPQAFEPILGDKVKFNTRVSKIEYYDQKVSVQWKKDPYDIKYMSEEYENVIVSVPFSIVRTWHLPKLDHILSRAIGNLAYSQACKVALEFKERFWEHLDKPIEGGCDDTDLLVGSICYPSNDIGSKGPGVVLASYTNGDKSHRHSAMTDDQHVARALEDFTELHGNLVREYYTGNYARHCWVSDPFQSGAYAEPFPGQHKLYMPSYFRIDNGMVFVGEHTDIKHGWISASLESAIHGVVLILVEHGHIDEAHDIVEKYNATWLTI